MSKSGREANPSQPLRVKKPFDTLTQNPEEGGRIRVFVPKRVLALPSNVKNRLIFGA